VTAPGVARVREHSKTEFGKKNPEIEFGESDTFYRSKFSRATGVRYELRTNRPETHCVRNCTTGTLYRHRVCIYDVFVWMLTGKNAKRGEERAAVCSQESVTFIFYAPASYANTTRYII